VREEAAPAQGAGTVAQPTSAPQAEITNAVLKVRCYLPDAQKGFYRGTRFDWSYTYSLLTAREK
jgi:hypothetical protein